MKQLTILVGLAASGKSTIASKMEQKGAIIVSSDAIRKELFGDESVQSNPAKVFQIFNDRIVSALRADNNWVVADACNIWCRKRKHFIQQVRTAIPEVHITTIVVATSLGQLYSNDENRVRHVGRDVINRQLRQFQMPCYWEGIDSIEIYYPFYERKSWFREMYFEENEIPHDNPHHQLPTIRDHMNAAFFDAMKDGVESPTVLTAIELHDIGKFFVKTFDERGVAHYYNHSNVGAYFSLFVQMIAKADPIRVAQLIQYHMEPFFKKGDHWDAWAKQVGQKFASELQTINFYDIRNA